MTKSQFISSLVAYFVILTSFQAFGAYENYNSVLIGDRAAGMAGAFTALSDDPSACSYYNPATLARMRGHSLSATANVFHKYDTNYGKQVDFDKASLRANQGVFKSIPASSGSVISFGNFAMGLSIVVPDYDFFSGRLQSKETASQSTNTLLQVVDESLWVGGTFSMNLSERQSFGLTVYYTSRNFQRSVVDETIEGGNTKSINEQKTFFNNSMIYLLGYYLKLSDRFAIGTSVRFPSIEISGRGIYYRSEIDTSNSSEAQTVTIDKIPSETRIPMKIALGLAYEVPKEHTFSFDLTYHAAESYNDLELDIAADRIVHRPIFNVAIGSEFYLKPWLRLRTGIFSNLSSHYTVPNTERRYADHIEMWGFSVNAGIFTSEKVSVTFGGYYTGGNGESSQILGQQLTIIPKSKQIFSMLVGSAFYF